MMAEKTHAVLTVRPDTGETKVIECTDAQIEEIYSVAATMQRAMDEACAIARVAGESVVKAEAAIAAYYKLIESFPAAENFNLNDLPDGGMVEPKRKLH